MFWELLSLYIHTLFLRWITVAKQEQFFLGLSKQFQHNWRQGIFELKVFFRFNAKITRFSYVDKRVLLFRCCHFLMLHFITLFLNLALLPRMIRKLRDLKKYLKSAFFPTAHKEEISVTIFKFFYINNSRKIHLKSRQRKNEKKING